MIDGQHQKPLYATLALRIKASVIDSTILLALIILIPLTIGQFPDHPGLRAFLMYSPLLFLEPLLVTFTGSTIGQRVMGIAIVDHERGSRLALPLSFVRYFIKVLLGGLSLVWMFFTSKRQAIHDRLVGTVVILSSQRIAKKPSFAAEGEGALEPEPENTYPSILRRFVFFLLWYCAATLLLSSLFLGVTYLLSPGSISDDLDLPKSVERVEHYLDSILFLFMGALAAKGRLPGARKIATLPDPPLQ